MKFKFDSNQDFQLEAIAAVVDLFEGCVRPDEGFALRIEHGVIPNTLTLSEQDVLQNLQGIQQRNAIEPADELQGMDFSVEMETGTGKTYVYLRTMLELNRRYGFKKFIVVVPSVAIREGVLKSLEMTQEHFAELYENLPYRYYEYSSGRISRLRQFATRDTVEIMVMTIDSFNKDSNVIKNYTDRLAGVKPIELVQATRPILVLDEPQNMESDIAREALADLNPLLKLRYSATHRRYYNLVYRLGPVEAYDRGLVKKIEVLSVFEEHNWNSAYIRCEKTEASKSRIRARLRLLVKDASGQVKPKTRTVKLGDDLYQKTNFPVYEGFEVAGIDAGVGEVRFTNGVVLAEGEEQGTNKQELMRIQIEQTVEEHMRKHQRLKRRGIKVLSLFFIDTVANYTAPDGFIRQAFVEAFERVKPRFEDYREVEVGDVHGGYFSEYRSEKGMARDEDLFQLIMQDKERLLSFDTPLEFIFSHSALREGWDNPNVFNICTLNDTVSAVKKRQEIGRGVRLAVNQEGQRLFDPEVNRLTVIANESYRDYVAQLQTEYVDEFGEGATGPKPEDARKRVEVQRKPGVELDENFRELWSRIAKRTRYRVAIETERLIEECVEDLAQLDIPKVQARIVRGVVQWGDEGVETTEVGTGAEEVEAAVRVPNLLDLIEREIEERLTRRTVAEIVTRSGKLGQAFNNPQMFALQVASIINHHLRAHLVSGIRYVEIGDAYEMSLLKESISSYVNRLVAVGKSAYPHIVCDSATEKRFAKALDEREEVKLFIKLPSDFVVSTPVGTYNPDWAVVAELRDQWGELRQKLYLVAETKGRPDEEQLRQMEEWKIECAKRHFEQFTDVEYKVASSVDELI